MIRLVLIALVVSLLSPLAYAGREVREERQFSRPGHAIKMICFELKDIFEVEVIIDGEKVFTAHHVPENMIDTTFNRLEDRLDAMIEEHEETLAFFGAIG